MTSQGSSWWDPAASDDSRKAKAGDTGQSEQEQRRNWKFHGGSTKMVDIFWNNRKKCKKIVNQRTKRRLNTVIPSYDCRVPTTITWESPIRVCVRAACGVSPHTKNKNFVWDWCPRALEFPNVCDPRAGYVIFIIEGFPHFRKFFMMLFWSIHQQTSTAVLECSILLFISSAVFSRVKSW